MTIQVLVLSCAEFLYSCIVETCRQPTELVFNHTLHSSSLHMCVPPKNCFKSVNKWKSYKQSELTWRWCCCYGCWTQQTACSVACWCSQESTGCWEGVGHSPTCGARVPLSSLQCADTDICSTGTIHDYHKGQCHAPVMMLYQLHWVQWQRQSWWTENNVKRCSHGLVYTDIIYLVEELKRNH